MSRTVKGEKGPGYEYWASRCQWGSVGRWTKTMTHRHERQDAKRLIERGNYDLLRTHAAGGINYR